MNNEDKKASVVAISRVKPLTYHKISSALIRLES